MVAVVIQMGHCFRRSGATGTHREQEFASTVGPRLQSALRVRGHGASLIGADDSVPDSDVFVALHCDGNVNGGIRGASVGYPDSKGSRLAQAWKQEHTRQGFPGGWHSDNYTDALRRYYGFGRSGAPYRFLAEHGTTTNRSDEAWLFANIDRCVQAHVDAIGSLFSHPNPSPATPGDAVGKYGHKFAIRDPKVAPDDKGRIPHWAVNANGDTFAWNGARPIPNIGSLDGDEIYFAELDSTGDGIILFRDDGAQEPDGSWNASTYHLRAR